jgi:predicted permease
MPLIRKLQWWLRRRGREAELEEELQFHLSEEIDERRAEGLPADEARWAARRDMGNTALVREDARTLWSWTPVEQLAQDIRYGVRGMAKNPTFTALAALSLALGIGANTAIYSFMDAILLRGLPVRDPASLVVIKWRSQPIDRAAFVLRSIDGRTYQDDAGVTAAIFPFPAFELLHQASGPVLSSLFAYKAGGSVNVLVRGEADLAASEFVSGDFFGGLSVAPLAGRLIQRDDDRPGAAPVAVLSAGYSQRRFGEPIKAIGQPILLNNVAFTVVGVTPAEFFGVDPAAAPQVYLPMRATGLLEHELGEIAYVDGNYYWLEMMGRLKPGVSLSEAQAALAGPFGEWVATTARDDPERANLPELWLDEGAKGVDSLRRQYSTPLYVLLAMVALILAIACANTASLLLARSAARSREIAVRLSLGAGRWRVVRQLLTESVLLATLSGTLGILFAIAGMRVLTALLANGQEQFTLHAELNWHVLLVTLALSLLCGMLFGLAPALQATRPALMQSLRDRSVTSLARMRAWRPSLTQALVTGQIATSLLLLVGAGLFVRTLNNLQSVTLGYNRESVLLFEINARQAGLPEGRLADFYGSLRNRLGQTPGVTSVTLSHASLVRAGRSHPISVDGRPTDRGARILWTGSDFFTTMEIPILRGRQINDSDRHGSLRVVVVSDLFARTYLDEGDPLGRYVEIGGSMKVDGKPMAMQIVGVAANARYGPLRRWAPPVVYVPFSQVPASELEQATYAIRTLDDPLSHSTSVRQVVSEADARVPVTNLKTQAADIDQTINQEIVFARLCTAFAILALTIASVGLYATMAYSVARRTNEIGLRLALGARRSAVVWMILRDVCVLAVAGLAIGASAALVTSRLVESFLFETKPNDPVAVAAAAAILVVSALVAGYAPAWRASRVDPLTALRHE